ncbi:uncharacterized protein MONBRDRAFT_38336 [Monosiga brevicollis MX1]|uniref:J domain-containing protein n=1 Tax=Monosiga brevicollis TaxID=81824 RepID=A9V732_MONBE|nr:uncharacterized protein MONBRDRAFT_38336 [Monosiga brevicollis MX1]EDQ86720.1 predicted protein [Monosiga brevicollis MX1]|eukprot:XP_001748556.1 hypothetical protein [Monosiga brevicollis MX1]
MKSDYYDVLGLKQSASVNQIQDAYRRLALEYHPDRNPSGDAPSKFQQVAEAYVVLSSAKLRAVFDNFGEEGLRDGAPQGYEGFTEPYVFHGDADAVFREFFGTDNPYQDMFAPNDEFGFGPKPSLAQQLHRKQDPAIEQPLYLTMEEVYRGCVKKMRISRTVLNDDGHTTLTKEKILTVKVKPGWREGTKITFPKEGDQGPNNIPADVVFVIKYLDHPRFKRRGNDLVHTTHITLVEALCGCIVELLTLDGRKLSIPINDVIKPGFQKVVAGEGMPITKLPGQRGNLVLEFHTEFPRNLSDDRKALIRQALGPSATSEAK